MSTRKAPELVRLNNEGKIKLLLDYNEAAEALGMTRAALRDLVYKGRGPVTVKIGSRVFFWVDDLIAFVMAHREGVH